MNSFENANGLALVALVAVMLIAICIFAWGIYKLVKAIGLLMSSKGSDSRVGGYLGQAIQVFLIGLVALFLSFSLYLGLFGTDNLFPGRLAHYDHLLIARLGILIILIIAGFSIKRLIDTRRSK